MYIYLILLYILQKRVLTIFRNLSFIYFAFIFVVAYTDNSSHPN